MIVPFNFNHCNHRVDSILVFNFRAVKDVILVIPSNKTIMGVGDEIFFCMQDIESKKWYTPHWGAYAYPDTFSRLNHRLEAYFREYDFHFSSGVNV